MVATPGTCFSASMVSCSLELSSSVTMYWSRMVSAVTPSYMTASYSLTNVCRASSREMKRASATLSIRLIREPTLLASASV